MMSAKSWTSALSPHSPPVPKTLHWGASVIVSLAALATGIYGYAQANLPDRNGDEEVLESVIVSLGAPAQRLEEPPPPPPDQPPPPEPTEPLVPMERAEDAPPPAPPPQPRPVFHSSNDGRPSSGFGTGNKPAPPPPPLPPAPPKELSRAFIDISTYAYVSRVQYPYNAMKRQQEGVGRLLVVINRAGVIQEWRLVRSTGHSILDREIERVAKQVEQLDPLPPDWDKPTASLIIPFSFVLDR